MLGRKRSRFESTSSLLGSSIGEVKARHAPDLPPLTFPGLDLYYFLEQVDVPMDGALRCVVQSFAAFVIALLVWCIAVQPLRASACGRTLQVQKLAAASSSSSSSYNRHEIVPFFGLCSQNNLIFHCIPDL